MGTLVRLPPGQEMTAGILKAIIEKCGTCNPCKAAGSATGSPPSKTHPTGCCTSVLLGDCLSVTISGGSVYDGTYRLNFVPAASSFTGSDIWATDVLVHPCFGQPFWLGGATVQFFYSLSCLFQARIPTAGGGFTTISWQYTNPGGGIACSPYVFIGPRASTQSNCNSLLPTTVATIATLTEC